MRNLPNILSAIRLALVPFFPIIFFSDYPNHKNIALTIFVLASLTDLVDGYIARKYNYITKIGIVLDPLADKLMLITVVYSLYVFGTLPVWVFLFVILKETFMIIAGLYMYLKKEKFVIPSNYYGKAATMLFFIAILINILMPTSPVSLILIIIAMMLKVIALITYIIHYIEYHRKCGY